MAGVNKVIIVDFLVMILKFVRCQMGRQLPILVSQPVKVG